jgi:cyclopropane-fatty-acyl-phospholipid synthase
MINDMIKKLNNLLIRAVEFGLFPDFIVRYGIRLLLRKRLYQIHSFNCEYAGEIQANMVSKMLNSPIAVNTNSANEQHYEVSDGFYQQILGDRYKYSCCFWESNNDCLDDAEIKALEITCRRANIQDGMKVLDLGCGWGSLSLWVAEHYPNCSVTSVSNSVSQHSFISKQAIDKKLNNIQVIVADMNDFDIDCQFDRIVSLEMFEHMKNYQKLYQKVSGWLLDEGLFFMHIFCHKSSPYEFIDKGPNDWMSRYFFTGGIMPSDDLPLFFQEDLVIQKRWRWNGEHYAKTSNAWLEAMDAKKKTLIPIIEDVYGVDDSKKWWQRWRIFFMSCAELFAFNNGQEWYVSHYLFRKQRANYNSE